MRKIILATVLLSSIISCKKYPEGPLVSLRSREARVANEWVCGEVLVNQQDNTGLYADYYFNFNEGGTLAEGNGAASATGTWKLTGNDDSLVCTINGNTILHRFRIIKLKNKSMWLDEERNGSLYSWHLISK